MYVCVCVCVSVCVSVCVRRFNNAFHLTRTNTHETRTRPSVFYTGVSAPYNVSNPYSTATLKDGTNLLIEVQAAAVTTDTDMNYWNKQISVRVPPNSTSAQVNPLLPAPPLPYTAAQLSGFRDPSVASVAATDNSMVVGSGFLSNVTQGIYGGGAVFTYVSSDLVRWGYSGILFQANHTLADTNGTQGNGVSVFSDANVGGVGDSDSDTATATATASSSSFHTSTLSSEAIATSTGHTKTSTLKSKAEVGVGAVTVDPVLTDEMWECPELFELPVINAPAMGTYKVLLYGSKHKVVYHIGQLVPIAEAVGAESKTYPRGNSTFVSYVTGVLDTGYFYAARSQPYAENAYPNNKNTYNNGEIPSELTVANSRILWGWINEAAYRTTEQNIKQGWAGVMSLPRTLTLEYHVNANSFTTESSYTENWPARNYMYNSDVYLSSAQQASKASGATGLQLVMAPAPAIQTLRQYAKSGISANHTIDFSSYPTALDASDAVYNNINIYEISADVNITLGTALASFQMSLLDLNGAHFAYINVTTVTDYDADTGMGSFARTMLSVGNNHIIENQCASLLGYETSAPSDPADADFAFYAKTPMNLRVVLDASVLEVFLNDRCSITQRIYTLPAFRNHPLKILITGRNTTMGLNAVQQVRICVCHVCVMYV